MSKNRDTSFNSTSCSTVVVEIDEKSLCQLGQWPWPRIVMAKALQEILKQRPATVGMDLFFPELDRTSSNQITSFYRDLLGLDVELKGLPEELADNDLIFSHALKAGPTVLSLFSSSEPEEQGNCQFLKDQFLPLPEGLRLPEVPYFHCNIPILQQAAQGLGYINASADKDGVFRRLPLIINYQNRAVPSLALAMLRQVDPCLSIAVSEEWWSPATITFAGKMFFLNRRGEVLNLLYAKESFRRISIAKVISGAVPKGMFTGKMVLIGSTAAGLYDQHLIANGDHLPGVYIHAALLENIMHEHILYQPDYTKKIALVLAYFFSLIVVWLVFQRHYLVSWGIFLGTSSVALLITWIMLIEGVYISIGYFLTPFSFLFFFISMFFAVLHYVERKHFLEDLGDAHSATIDSMTMVAESRDIETGSHIVRTKEYVRLLARHLSRSASFKDYLTPHIIDLFYRAAPLHDIGKVGIPDAILQKPAPLNEKEWEIMRSHVLVGRKIVENAINSYNKTNEFLSIASNIVYSHHEKWDGSGYPLGLKGDSIPLEGRLMALADVYDALISRRRYKEPFSFAVAEEIIADEKGKHFDPLIVEIFFELKTEFRHIAESVDHSYD